MNATADTLRGRMVNLADALDVLANDAAQVHADMRDRGNWGTGVTGPVERELEKLGERMRSLVAIMAENGGPR